MRKQERIFTLAEVHTNVGIMGEVRLDESFMSVLGVKPGESISFLIDAQGAVTVKGWTNKQVVSAPPIQSGVPRPGDVIQEALFTDVSPTRRRVRK